MKIPQGYKQTELGTIPEDWEVVCIGNLGYIIGGGTPSTSNSQYWDGGIQWFTPSEIGKSKYVSKSCRTISKLGLQVSSANLLPKGTILLTTRASIGESAILSNHAATNQGFQSIIVDNSFSNEFIYYILKQSVGTMLELASGSTFLEISKKKLSSINIVVPRSRVEQQAIAEALSDVDALIAALDKKIAKKRLIKQGAMQQFLTGKMQLAGFFAPWIDVEIGDIAILYQPITIAQDQFTIQGYNVYGANGIIGKYSHYNHSTDQVLITCRGSNCGTVNYSKGYCWITGNAMVVNMDGNKNVNKQFIYYLLSNNDLSELITGSGQPQIVRKVLSEYSIRIPLNYAEQHAIASILSDMDNEIAELETRRDKYKLIKSGMMQKLLTGQIRLVKPLAPIIPLETPDVQIREIPLQTHVVAGHIVNALYQSSGWGRTKLQKTLHLVGYHCQLDFGNDYIRNTAGPDDQAMMNHIDSKFKQYRHVRIEAKKENEKTRYNYIPTTMIDELEQVYETYPQTIRHAVDSLINKIKKMDLACAEIVSTLYAVWNNRIIKGEPISDDLLLEDFYAWSKHKLDFSPDQVLCELNYMRKEEIIPIGWGKYIDKK